MVAPKHHRGFSFGSKSSKSHQSNSSGNSPPIATTPVTETAEDKVRRSLKSKADPTVAMSELQPMAVALEKSNLGNIREMPHKDQYGNLITDPDLSNPTRPRLERPLDTIRSFEAAVHGTYKSRNSAYLKSRELGAMHYQSQQSLTSSAGGESTPGDLNGRESYFGGANEQSRYGPSRRESYTDGYNQPSENYYPYNRNSRSRPRYSRRTTTDQSYGGAPARNGYAVNGYQNAPQEAYHPAYQGTGLDDNITAASGSGTDPYGISTDPSSVDSSLDQLQQQQLQQDKRMNGSYEYNQPPAPVSQARPKHVFGAAPAPDPNSGGPVGGPVGGGAAAQGNRRHLRKSTNVSEASKGDGGGKRKSWFKRRFSKS